MRFQRSGEKGLSKNTLNITFNGSAGQSFSYFSVKLNMTVYGNTNDYFDKSLSGAAHLSLVQKSQVLFQMKTL